MNSVAKYFPRFLLSTDARLAEITKPIEIDEVTALMRYSAKQGSDPDDTLSKLSIALAKYNNSQKDAPSVHNLYLPGENWW